MCNACMRCGGRNVLFCSWHPSRSLPRSSSSPRNEAALADRRAGSNNNSNNNNLGADNAQLRCRSNFLPKASAIANWTMQDRMHIGRKSSSRHRSSPIRAIASRPFPKCRGVATAIAQVGNVARCRRQAACRRRHRGVQQYSTAPQHITSHHITSATASAWYGRLVK